MEKKDLLLLKDKLERLSEIEKKQRDEYLKNISIGKIQGPMTGYSSIDKPWLKFYREKPIKEINPMQTMYQMVFDQKDMNLNAIGYLGKNWTYKKLKKEVDKCADAFNKIGISKNSVVLIGMSNSPETVVILLALNKLGAISKWFDLRASESDIEEYANSSNCQFMVAVDIILPKIEKVIDNTKLKKVIVVNPAESLSPVMKLAVYLKKKKQDNCFNISSNHKYIKYSKFMKMGNANLNLEYINFDKERPTIMIQSSGTTGKPKTIIHSDYSITQCVREIAYSDLPIEKGKEVLVALPPWIAYGIGDAIILPLALGSKVELNPDFDPDAVFKNVGKFTVAFAAPFHYRYLKENFDKLTVKQKKQFERVECLISGGDKISAEENEEFEKIFDTTLVNGYGNQESWGALSVNPTQYNKYGTVGIPKYDETIISYDTEKNIELPYGELGELCSLSHTKFLEYENNPEATKECKRLHDDQNVWMHTGDLGYIDSEGYVHLGGRTRRVIVRQGFKISAYTIEDSISNIDFVKECVAVSVMDKDEEHVPMVYIVLKDEYKNRKDNWSKIIFDYCIKNLKEYEIPKYLQIVNELPYTQNGKYDFTNLEIRGNKYVSEKESEVKILRKK